MNKFLTVIAFMAAILAPALAGAQGKVPLGDISTYLNGLKSAQSSFTQYNDDGSRSSGTLYLKRPGRMRFEYKPPNQAVVIAGGGTVIIHDPKSNQAPETYPLKRTPLSIILARQVDLGRVNMVVGHSYDGKHTIVRAQDPENRESGHIDLMFSGAPLKLAQWVITDGEGIRTAVVLADFQSVDALSDSLFNTQAPGGVIDR